MNYISQLRDVLAQHVLSVYLPYVEAIIIFIAIAIVFRIVFGVLIAWLTRRAKASANRFDDALVAIFKTLRPPFYLILAALLALQTFSLPEKVAWFIQYALVITLVVQAIIALVALITFVANELTKTEQDNSTAILFGSNILKGIVWVVGLLFLLSNLGINVTSLAASLGIGGIAVALALQNILSDLFSSFTIYFDKPFRVGDFIIVGDKMGTVEQVGIKTTRLRALQGEQVIISNQELTQSQIQNFKRLEDRRAVITLGVTYDTSQEKMKKIPELIKGIISGMDGVDFDRAHFNEFGDFALMFEVVYFVHSPEYAVFMDVKQNILLDIKGAFEEEGIEMAFPTQTLYHKREE